jgi:hypothetical protein
VGIVGLLLAEAEYHAHVLFLEKHHHLLSPGADTGARLPADVPQWLAQKEKMMGDRYDLVTIYSVKDLLDELGLVQKKLY